MVALCNRDNAKSDRGYKTLAAVAMGNPKEQKPCMTIRKSFVCGRPYEAFWSQHELVRKVIVDLGCVKSVVGVKWMRPLLTEWRDQQRWFKICPEKEVFQFGNGQSLISRYAVQFEAIIAGAHVIINMSVVEGHCPPLLSRHACTQLGLNIDCGTHSLSSRKMNVKKFGPSQASNGHYLLEVGGFEDIEVGDIPDDFEMTPGCEAWIIRPAVNQRIEREDSAPSCEAPRSRPVAAVDGGDIFGAECCEEGEAREDSSEGMPIMRRSRSPRTGMPTTECRVRGGRDASGSRVPGRCEEEAKSATCRPGTSDAAVSSSTSLGTLRDGPKGGAGQPGVGYDQRADTGGEADHCQEEGQDYGRQDEACHSSGTDRRGCGLPQPESCMVIGGGPEHGVLVAFEDEGVPVEEAGVATASEGCSRENHERREMEAKSSVAISATGERSGGGVWSLRGNATEDEQPRHVAPDVEGQKKQSEVQRLQRGDVQRMKNGVAAGVNDALKTAAQEVRFVLLEIYAGSATLTKMARERNEKWTALEPVDILYGYDLTKLEDRKRVWKVIEEVEPDLITLAMPCGPWCQWMNLCDPDLVEAKRTESMPLWRFARQVWDHQLRRHRLALTENPLGSEGLKLNFMVERRSLHRAKVAQCCFGLKDVVNGKPHRKLTAFDVTCPVMAAAVEEGAVCMHRPEEHQVLEGKVYYKGEWRNRSALAGPCTPQLCQHIIRAAQRSLEHVIEVPRCALHAECEPGHVWEVAAVESGHVAEEELRKKMGELGVAADRYGYVTFEGAGQQVPRRIRAAVAHIHSTLGHPANDRLVRMLLLSGAGQQVLDAARNLRCEVCSMVQPPRDAPQVAISKPSAFNVRVSGDTFYTWDTAGTKYAVVHFLDGLTDYHVADCTIHADSGFAASVLRDQWYGIFGPPDVLLTDVGTEFSGAVDVLNEIFGVKHDIIPDGAKWRLGQAERHGAILKLMMMKMTREMSIKDKDGMRMAASAACAAKNRLCNHGGVSPLQAVTGRNAVLPPSLMTQICSGKMRFVINDDLDKEESLRRAERIRMAAVESFYWIDAHTTLRRALAAKSRPPKLEMLREGAVVYVYDPPANRRGLARRMQDNISWQGPGTVVCVERDRNIPNRISVRMKGKVKSVPLEKIRLATVEETVSGHFIKEALEDVQKELTSGRMKVERVERDPDGERFGRGIQRRRRA